MEGKEGTAMRIRDISVKKRLLFANFMMVFVPVCLLAIIGIGIVAGFRLTGTARQSQLSMFWPEKGPALSVQFAVSSLSAKAEKKGFPKLREMAEECHALEYQGINTVILHKGSVVYSSPGSDILQIEQTVRQHCGESPSMMQWNDEGFVFSYTAQHNDTTILASGETPFLSKGGQAEETTKDILEMLMVLILGTAIVVIVVLGIYLSRLMSRQILEPLDTLRAAAAEIRQGNLDKPLNVPAQDELGNTCRDFELMRQQLKIARENQTKYEQNRKELLAGISHDLSTPLTSLKGYASGILDGIARTPEKRIHYVKMIYHTACSMEKLVESLFLFSKLDLGRLPFHRETVCLYRYFEDFTLENRAMLAERGLDLTFTGDNTPACAVIDRMQFQRVVENLLGNSIKYKKGETVQVQISVTATDKEFTIAFADNGIGVSTEDLPKIFDSFYRTDPARTNVAKGSGLGLAIVKQIILGLQGRIWAGPTAGGGLTIYFTLPVSKGETP